MGFLFLSLVLLTGCPVDIPCPLGGLVDEESCTCVPGTRSDGGMCVGQPPSDDPAAGAPSDAGRGPRRSADAPANAFGLDASVMDVDAGGFAPESPVRLEIDAGGSPFPSADPTSTFDLTPILPSLPPSTSAMQAEPLVSACSSKCSSGACDDQGRCQACTSDTHCTAMQPKCVDHRCVECLVSADCGTGGTCENNACRASSRMTCPNGSPAKDGSCPATRPTAPAQPVCNDGFFDAREECEIGFGGVPPNVYDETNCDRNTCKRIYWQECDPSRGNADCPRNATCLFGGSRAICVPRACPRKEPDCTGSLASVPEQCPRMPLYPVVNFSTLCFMTCDPAAPRCPGDLKCQAGICIFPIGPGIDSVTRTVH